MSGRQRPQLPAWPTPGTKYWRGTTYTIPSTEYIWFQLEGDPNYDYGERFAAGTHEGDVRFKPWPPTETNAEHRRAAVAARGDSAPWTPTGRA